MKEVGFVLEFLNKVQSRTKPMVISFGISSCGHTHFSITPESPILHGIFFFTQAFQTLPLSCLVSPSRTVRN